MVISVLLLVLVLGLIFDYKIFINKRKAKIKKISFIDSKYGQIKYLDIGNKSDPPILFVGGGGAGLDSAVAFEWLTENGFRVISINRPGYYGLNVEDVSTIELHADIYDEVLRTLEVENPHVFGISMGGVSALYFAQKYKVKSLVLWSAVTGKYTVNEESTQTPLAKIVLSPKGKDIVSWLLMRSAMLMPRTTQKEFIKPEASFDNKTINNITKQTIGDGKTKKEFILFAESMTPMSLTYDGMMDEIKLTQKDFSIDWDQLIMPVKAYYSPYDKDVSEEHSDRLKDNISHIDLNYVKACGHYVWWGDEREEVIGGTIDFFKKNN